MKPLLEKYFSVVKHLIPQKPIISSVGLDIGVDSCKAIEVLKMEDQYHVLGFGVEPIVNGDQENAIKKLVEKLDITSKDTYTAVFGKGTLIRNIEMPRMPLAELKKSFEFEVDRYLPFSKDQIYTSCYILDPKSKEKQMSVLIGAAKKEIVNERIDLLTKVGLQANFVSLNSIAVANVFHTLEAKPEGPTAAFAILDIGETVSNLVILLDNAPRFTRDIFMGGLDFSKKISMILGVSLDEGKKLKSTPGEKEKEVVIACETVLMNLISEIRLSFDYFTTEWNVSVSKLLLSGGSCLMGGINESLSKSLDIPVERWNPIASLRISPDVSQDEIQNQSHRLGVALGLSLYHYD